MRYEYCEDLAIDWLAHANRRGAEGWRFVERHWDDQLGYWRMVFERPCDVLVPPLETKEAR